MRWWGVPREWIVGFRRRTAVTAGWLVGHCLEILAFIKERDDSFKEASVLKCIICGPL